MLTSIRGNIIFKKIFKTGVKQTIKKIKKTEKEHQPVSIDLPLTFERRKNRYRECLQVLERYCRSVTHPSCFPAQIFKIPHKKKNKKLI